MTQLNWNRQLALAAGLFIIGTGAYWFEYRYQPQKEATKEEGKKIFSLKETPVENLTLQFGTQRISFECLDRAQKLCKPGDSSRWKLTHPLVAQADSTQVNTFLSSLNTLNPIDTIDLKTETTEKKEALLKQYGLDSSSLKTASQISITSHGKSSTLYIGRPHPIGETFFASKLSPSDSQIHLVYLIPKSFESQIEHPVLHWRNKKLFDKEPHEIESISLQSSQNKLQLTQAEGKWKVEEGDRLEIANPNAVYALLRSISSLNAKNFIEEKKKIHQTLQGAVKKLTLSFKAKSGDQAKTDELVLYSKKEKNSESLYATASQATTLFELPYRSLSDFTVSFQSLRDKTLFSALERFAVQKIEISGGKYGTGPLVLFQENSQWKTPSTEVTPQVEGITAFLDFLSHAKIQEFLGRPIPQEKSALKVVLFNGKGEPLRSYAFWEKNQKSYAFDLSNPSKKQKETFLLEKSASQSLPWDPRSLIQTISSPPSEGPSKK